MHKRILKYVFAALFILAGLNHFRSTEFYVRMMLPYLPWHLFLVYASGLAEVALGTALLVPRLERLAACGLIALLIAVFPANIHMAVHPELFPEFSSTLLWARLPVQAVLIAWAYWYSGNDRIRASRTFVLSLLVLATALLPQGCHPTEPVAPERALVKSSAIIIVPGFKGTALKRADTGERVWITAGEALAGNATLAWNDSRLDLPALDLKTDGLLKKVRIIPGLFSLDVYGSLTGDLRKRFADADVVELAYDWREDPIEAVNALGALVSNLHARGIKSISIVAHSFGGYIAAYYLRYGVQDLKQAAETWQGAAQVDRVIFLGTPFLGAMIKFRDMLTGETVGLNRSLLDATAHSSFPASYFLLPAPAEPPFISPGGHSLPISLYDVSSWRDRAWGLFAQQDRLSMQAKSGRLGFVSLYLDRAARFSSLVNAPPGDVPTVPINILQVVGHGRATLAQATVKQQELAFKSSEDGDGIVTARSAELPAAYRQAAKPETIETTAAHHELWKGEGVEAQIVRFLSSREVNRGSVH